MIFVTPLAGVWIEIESSWNLCRTVRKSLPLRERGLKFEKEDDRRFSNYGTSMEKLFGYEQVAKRIANIRLTIKGSNEEKVEFS